MAEKEKQLDLPILAKNLNTRVRKTEKTLGEFIRYKLPKIKGIIYLDGSGGFEMKVPGLDFFLSHGTIWDQLKEIEEKIEAYKALEPDIKKLKKAVSKSQIKVSAKPYKHGDKHVHKHSKKEN